MENVMNLITAYGIDTALIAIATTILTGIVKMPIKRLAQKSKNSHAITRFITFLPVIFGFGATVLATWLLNGAVDFTNEAFYIQWLSAVSLSLAIYAFWEKFVPSKSKILSEAEISANEELIERIGTLVGMNGKTITKSDNSAAENNPIGEEVTEETPGETETTYIEESVIESSADSSVSGELKERPAAKIVLHGGRYAEAAKEQ